jgi:hypothetical protein
MTQYCPACGDEVVPNSGSEECDFAIIEELPELVLPTPAMQSKWSKDEWTPKKILSNELDKIGMVIQQFRVIAVYPHTLSQAEVPVDSCYESGFSRMLEEIQRKRGVIILGARLCKEFTGHELKQVQGLSRVESQYLPDANVPRMFLPSIKTIYSTGAGEFRIGLRRFSVQLGEK